jgi:hypothetical protein
MAQTNANLIWKIADLLRGPYQPNQAVLQDRQSRTAGQDPLRASGTYRADGHDDARKANSDMASSAGRADGYALARGAQVMAPGPG